MQRTKWSYEKQIEDDEKINEEYKEQILKLKNEIIVIGNENKVKEKKLQNIKLKLHYTYTVILLSIDLCI